LIVFVDVVDLSFKSHFIGNGKYCLY